MTSFFTALIDHSDLSQSNVLVMMSQLTVLVFAYVFALEPQVLDPGNSENHMVIMLLPFNVENVRNIHIMLKIYFV